MAHITETQEIETFAGENFRELRRTLSANISGGFMDVHARPRWITQGSWLFISSTVMVFYL